MDVTTASFQTEVIERSKTTPVLVDFWAAWCGPCRMLGPVLEKLAGEPGARFELAKVDTDANPELASRYRISGIPDVKLFSGGEVVGEFKGALPEAAVRQFIDAHIPNEADQLVAAGKPDEALKLDANHAGAHLALAEAALASGDIDAASTHLEAIDPRSDEAADADNLRDAMVLIRIGVDAGGVDACLAAVEASPDDLQARYDLGCALVGAGGHRQALEQFLDIVRRNKKWNDQAGRKAMLQVFKLIGVRSPLADEMRSELAMYL